MNEQDEKEAGNLIGYIVAFALIVTIGYQVVTHFL
jgi:hypothetical protein